MKSERKKSWLVNYIIKKNLIINEINKRQTNETNKREPYQ